MEKIDAFVGLGSNLGDRAGTIVRALELLDAVPQTSFERAATVRETAPVGFLDQPPFLNTVALVRTALRPRQLLEHLLAIERRLGRVRTSERYGPRTLDLDLLLYGDEQVDEDGLRVPHPRLHERRFVLEPLADLDPGLVVPGRGAVAELLAGID